MSEGLIDSQEMYLRTVLELEEEEIPALRARLVDRLGLSAPSVSEGVRRMVDDGLLVLNDDRTVGFTDTGRAQAHTVMRKHRLAERLLVDVLGVEDEHVHEEACRWEHVISDRVEQRLVEFLGNPTTSPYGNPIPGSPKDDLAVLSLARSDADEVRLERISERVQADHGLMAALADARITPGTDVRVERDKGLDEELDGELEGGLVLVGPRGQVTVSDDAAPYLYVSER